MIASLGSAGWERRGKAPSPSAPQEEQPLGSQDHRRGDAQIAQRRAGHSTPHGHPERSLPEVDSQHGVTKTGIGEERGEGPDGEQPEDSQYMGGVAET